MGGGWSGGKIGQVVAMIDATGSSTKSEPKETAAKETAAKVATPAPQTQNQSRGASSSPAVRRLAAEEKIPLGEVNRHGEARSSYQRRFG